MCAGSIVPMASVGFGTFLALDEKNAPDLFERYDNFRLRVAQPSSVLERERKRDTGVRTRLIIRENKVVLDLVRGWVQRWLDETKISKRDIGGLVIATCSCPDLEQLACDVQMREGIPGHVIAVDEGCTGWPRATKEAMILCHETKKKILVVAAEATSHLINWEDPSNVPSEDDQRARGKAKKIFGDGVAGSSVEPIGPHTLDEILDAHVVTLDDPDDLIRLQPVADSWDVYDKLRKKVHDCISMPGRNGFHLLEQAPKIMIERLRASVQRAKAHELMEEWQEVDHVVSHQANRAIIDGIRPKVAAIVWDCIEKSGNTAGASIPNAYAAVQHHPSIHTHQIIGMPALGAKGEHFVRGKLSAGCVLIRKGNRKR